MTERRCSRRRFWSASEKRRIVSESFAPGVSVAAVALRHGINANLVFKWRRDPRFCGGGPSPSFLPVAVPEGLGERIVDGASGLEPAENAPSGTVLELGGGMRLCFGSPVSVPCLVRLVSELRSAS